MRSSESCLELDWICTVDSDWEVVLLDRDDMDWSCVILGDDEMVDRCG